SASLSLSDVQVTRQGDLVTVTQPVPIIQPQALRRTSSITIHVPAHTDVDVNDVTRLEIQGIDGNVRVQGNGSADLRDVVLRGASTFDAPIAALTMTNVTIAGAATITKAAGDVSFSGSLAPGGSSLDIDSRTGDVTVKLPHPTDARAAISTQVGELGADPSWHFASDPV